MALDDLLNTFRSLKNPEDEEDTLSEAPESPEMASMEQPMVEPSSNDESLQDVLQRRQDMLKNLGLLRASTQIGQSIAGGQSGVFKPDYSGIPEMEKAAGLEVEDYKTKKKEKSDKAASDVYKQVIQQKYPNLEISDDISPEHLKSLLSNFKKASASFQQSQYMTKDGDPVTFDKDTNQYINPLNGKVVKSNDLIRNYVKTIKDPRTGEIIEVRPGVGAVGSITRSDNKAPKDMSAEDEVDYTYQMLNPNQREYFEKLEDDYAKDVKDGREFGEIIGNIDALIESDISAAIPAIQRQLARSVGREVGVMTDKDVEAFSGDRSAMAAMQRFAKKVADGKMTEGDKEQFKGIISIISKKLDQAIENRASFHIAKMKQRIPTATSSSIRNMLSVQASKPEAIRDRDKTPPETVKVKRKTDGLTKTVTREQANKILKDDKYEEVK